MAKRASLFLWLWLWLGMAAFAADPVRVEFFYEPGCHECEQIERTVLPELESRFAGRYELQRYDIGVESNFLALLELDDALGTTGQERSYLVVGRKVAFGASPNSQAVVAAVAALLEASGPADSAESGAPSPVVAGRYRAFTLPMVILAGLLDGLNPCAVSTLVFFMSLLAVCGVRRRALAVLGATFCLASFLTYLALGFGLLRALHLFAGFHRIRAALEVLLALILLALAVFSLLDACRFARSGDRRDIWLQLPDRLKRRIHERMRHGLKSRNWALAGFTTGVAVTAIESVCTGQVYVPVLTLILKDSGFADPRAWLLLLLYNALFVLPLVAVFAAVYSGLRTDRLLAWSRRHAVVSKVLLAALFLLLAFLMIL
jgi:cytochrome c biogenesis protein CcdA